MNGVGGSTIEEAKRSITYEEALSWFKYRNKVGSLNPAIRLEKTLAFISAYFANFMKVRFEGGRLPSMNDFLLMSNVEPDEIATEEQVFNHLSSLFMKEPSDNG